MSERLVANVGEVVTYFGESWHVGMVRLFADARPFLNERYYFLVKDEPCREVAMVPEGTLIMGMAWPRVF